MRYVAIGDIHGYWDSLTALYVALDRYGLDCNRDTVVFLGDYVDGGPNTRQVVSDLRALQQTYPHWVFLKGNHEDMLLQTVGNNSMDTWANWYHQGGEQTLDSYRPWPKDANPCYPEDIIPAGHLDWLRERPLIHETKSFIFVHGGLAPGLPLDGNGEQTLLWMREPFISSTYDWGKRVIFGHTYTPEPLVMPNKIGIDTMHRGGGRLSAVVLDDDDPEFYEFVTA